MTPHTNSMRFFAFQTALERPVIPTPGVTNRPELFATNVLTLEKLRPKLSKKTYNALVTLMRPDPKEKCELPYECAVELADAMKNWALSKGAVRFCHWFQPLLTLPCAKYDSFISTQVTMLGQTLSLDNLDPEAFMQAEGDASSLPNGGLRNTANARGYTLWDPTSPPFITTDEADLATLHIPCVFVSWKGHALCAKSQLLRSNFALSREAVRFLHLMGHKDITGVAATFGPEQEYFLVDRAFLAARPDIAMCGRTIIGELPLHNQQFEDHYWGSIPARIEAFMNESEEEMMKLGIPAKVRHNEVAPGQYEVAPLFEAANISADHNALTMEILTRTAQKHDFVCLLHEKPFAGLNGSGKHNNWSMITQEGSNLLKPGKKPTTNLRFLACCVAVLKAVHDHSKILRFATISAGNDHRLGGQEAPPAIISVFLGKGVADALDWIESGATGEMPLLPMDLSLGGGILPLIKRDRGDRNRSSPFAFTGNRFEFRMVGSTANSPASCSYINVAVAEALSQLSDRLEKKLRVKSTTDAAVTELIREVIVETKNIRYEGNCYEQQYVDAAAARGLPNLKTTPEVLEAVLDARVYEPFVKQGVLTKEEFLARHEIALEQYINQVEMEARVMEKLVRSHVYSAIEKEIQRRVATIHTMNSVRAKHQVNADRLIGLYSQIKEENAALVNTLNATYEIRDPLQHAKALAMNVVPAMARMRRLCDDAEHRVADELWMLPKYREMLFGM